MNLLILIAVLVTAGVITIALAVVIAGTRNALTRLRNDINSVDMQIDNIHQILSLMKVGLSQNASDDKFIINAIEKLHGRVDDIMTTSGMRFNKIDKTLTESVVAMDMLNLEGFINRALQPALLTIEEQKRAINDTLGHRMDLRKLYQVMDANLNLALRVNELELAAGIEPDVIGNAKFGIRKIDLSRVLLTEDEQTEEEKSEELAPPTYESTMKPGYSRLDPTRMDKVCASAARYLLREYHNGRIVTLIDAARKFEVNHNYLTHAMIALEEGGYVNTVRSGRGRVLEANVTPSGLSFMRSQGYDEVLRSISDRAIHDKRMREARLALKRQKRGNKK